MTAIPNAPVAHSPNQALQNNAIPPGHAPEEQNTNSAVGTAFADYAAPTDAASSCAKQAVIAQDAIERIAQQWERAGKDPESIKIIREGPNRWINTRESEQSVVLELARELDHTGELATLREQAIRIIRAEEEWQQVLDARVAKDPTMSRAEHNERMTEATFGWKPDSPARNIYILGAIIHANLTVELAVPA